MKMLKLRISVAIAVLLAGIILTSAATPIITNTNLVSKNDSVIKVEESIEYDDDYLAQVDAYVDQFFLENTVHFDVIENIKVYGENNELLVDGEKGNLNADQLRLLRQADLLSELNGTAYYQINN